MDKILIPFIFILGFMLASCDSSEEPEAYPIQFGHTGYTIRYATTARISFVSGGGKYELAASNPEVLGEFYIDVENSTLIVRPSSVGKALILEIYKSLNNSSE